MDGNHKNWVRGKNLNHGGGYGNFGPMTSKAWNQWGKDYNDEQNPPAPVNTDKYIWWSKSNEKSASMDLAGIQTEIDNGKIEKDMYVSKKIGGGKWETKKASAYTELDLGPDQPSIPDAPAAPAAPANNNQSQSTSNDASLGNTATNPTDSGSPFNSNGNTFPFDTTGFTEWFQQTYNDSPPDDLNLDPKKGYIVATDGTKQLIYTYNDELKRWNLPTTYRAEQGRSKLIVKKLEPAATAAPEAQASPVSNTTEVPAEEEDSQQ
jgi:hypothetical protein